MVANIRKRTRENTGEQGRGGERERRKERGRGRYIRLRRERRPPCWPQRVVGRMQIRPTQKRMQIRSAAGCEVGDAVYDQKERRDRRDKGRLKAGRDGNEPRAKKNPDKLEFSFLLYPPLYASTLLLFNLHHPLFSSRFFSLYCRAFFSLSLIIVHRQRSFSYLSRSPR